MSDLLRLLLFDMDGTLLGPDLCVRDANRAVLARAMEHGVRVGFATGRPPRSVRRYVEELSPTGPLVCFNGGLVWDTERDAPIARRALDVERAAAALERAEALGVHANLYLDDDIYIARESETSRASAVKDGVQQVVVGPLATWLRARGQGPTKILFIAPPEELPPLAEGVRGDDADSVLVNSEPDYLEMLPPGTSKGAALVDIERALGVPASAVCAFGDNLNDLELVRACGLGVAMDNAHEALRAAADVVIGGHDTDAIARFLEDELDWVEGGLRRRG